MQKNILNNKMEHNCFDYALFFKNDVTIDITTKNKYNNKCNNNDYNKRNSRAAVCI